MTLSSLSHSVGTASTYQEKIYSQIIEEYFAMMRQTIGLIKVEILPAHLEELVTSCFGNARFIRRLNGPLHVASAVTTDLYLLHLQVPPIVNRLKFRTEIMETLVQIDNTWFQLREGLENFAKVNKKSEEATASDGLRIIGDCMWASVVHRFIATLDSDPNDPFISKVARYIRKPEALIATITAWRRKSNHLYGIIYLSYYTNVTRIVTYKR